MSRENRIESITDVFETTTEVEPSIEAVGIRAKTELEKVIPVLSEQKAAIEAEIAALEIKREALSRKLENAKLETSEFGFDHLIHLSNWRRMNKLKASGPLANEKIRGVNTVLEENGLGEFALPLLDETIFPGE